MSLGENPNASGRPNRVRPDGSTSAVSDRGLFWGNRGQLLGKDGNPQRHSQGINWIICQLDFKDRQRTQWRAGRLTELYFLDEPTALAAGHRPCGECRFGDYKLFKSAWAKAHPADPVGAREIDRRLHADRLDPSGHRTYDAELTAMPEGTVIEHDGEFWLVRGAHVYRWSFAGYGEARRRSNFPAVVTIRTPRATVATLRAGYRPIFHPSAVPGD